MSLKNVVEKIPFYNELVRPWHWLQAEKAGIKYGWPAKKLKVIGVTGTNGKTTTCFMIWKMLNESGRKAGLLTTVGWGGVGLSSERSTALSSPVRSHRMSNTAPLRASSSPCSSSQMTSPTSLDATMLHKQFEHMTTERVEVLNERMRAIAEAGAEYLVLETTSHALMQYRTLGVPIEIAVFTNITHEHLDYHKTFENYRKAKQKLFKQARYGVVNMDDPNAKYFVNEFATGDVSTYGIKQGDYRATEIELAASGVSYKCGNMKIKTQIPGEFNVYNSLAAVCVGKKLGLDEAEIERGIAALTEVEGRMNRIQEGQEFEVIVDYAHTPDALEKVFESICEKRPADHTFVDSVSLSSSNPSGRDSDPAQPGNSPQKVGRATVSSVSTENALAYKEKAHKTQSGRIISVHGGAGRRDESTRAMRGEILGKYSDIVIITEDDSRDEDPAAIAEQFMQGAEKVGKVRGENLLLELDREKAIRKALKMAQKGDIVLILGKGHEKTILRADGAHEFEDIKVTREALRELGGTRDKTRNGKSAA